MGDNGSEGTVASAWAAARPELDVRPIEIFGRLRRLQELHIQAIEPLYSGASLSQSELSVLILLRYPDRPIIARELARQRGCSRAAMGKILTKLEARDLITRHPNPADRRAAIVEISPSGIEQVDALFPRQLALESALLETFDEQWRADLIARLNALSATLREAAQ